MPLATGSGLSDPATGFACGIVMIVLSIAAVFWPRPFTRGTQTDDEDVWARRRTRTRVMAGFSAIFWILIMVLVISRGG